MLTDERAGLNVRDGADLQATREPRPSDRSRVLTAAPPAPSHGSPRV